MNWSQNKPYLRPSPHRRAAGAHTPAAHQGETRQNLICLLLTLLGHLLALAWLVRGEAKTSAAPPYNEAVLQVAISEVTANATPALPALVAPAQPGISSSVQDVLTDGTGITPPAPTQTEPAHTPPAPAAKLPLDNVLPTSTEAPAIVSQPTPEHHGYRPSKDLSEKPRVLNNIEELELPGIEEQTLILQLFINEDGKIDKVELEQAKLTLEYQQIVIASFSRMTFSPGKIDGTPVKSLLRIEVALEAHLPELGSGDKK